MLLILFILMYIEALLKRYCYFYRQIYLPRFCGDRQIKELAKFSVLFHHNSMKWNEPGQKCTFCLVMFLFLFLLTYTKVYVYFDLWPINDSIAIECAFQNYGSFVRWFFSYDDSMSITFSSFSLFSLSLVRTLPKLLLESGGHI